ncbi:MAG: hypothetical protein U0984_10995, partial [Prosthecobacter sp.]|nr:hypothetical protein [Prosthecobacter sp.]
APNTLPDVLMLVVTVEELRMTLGPAEEHWRKASFMSWKEVPESFDAAFGDSDVSSANALRLRDMVRQMYQEKQRLGKFEEPYTDYMCGETGIGKKVRRSVTVAMQYHGDPHYVPKSEGEIRRQPVPSSNSGTSAFLPILLNCLTYFMRRPFARL